MHLEKVKKEFLTFMEQMQVKQKYVVLFTHVFVAFEGKHHLKVVYHILNFK